MSHQKPVIFITNLVGWSTRNFFQTGVIELLATHFKIIVIASPEMKAGLVNLGYHKYVEILEHSPGAEPTAWRLFRQIKKKLYFESTKSVTEATWEKHKKRPVYQKLGGLALKALGELVSPRKVMRVVEWVDHKFNKDKSMVPIFKKWKPKFILFTHATHFGDEIILRNAISLNVPCVYMILSWDHLSTGKVILSNVYRKIFVWNQILKNEILDTYPYIPANSVEVVGVPQFDFYAQKPLYSYSMWCQKYGLNQKRKTLLFSTMPQARHDQQHVIIGEILKWIENPKNNDLDLQMLVKTHPFDTYQGYKGLSSSDRIAVHQTSITPWSRQSEWTPAANEIEANRDSLFFCVLNINIYSTVTIEAACFDKPIIHIAFDPFPPKNRIPCAEYYKWDHFKPIVNSGASTLVNNFEELFLAIRRCVVSPNLQRDERGNLVRSYVGRSLGESVNTIAGKLVNLANELGESPL